MFELLSGFRFLCTMTHRCCKQMVCIENRFSHHKIRSFQAIEITLFTDAEFLLRHTSVCRAYARRDWTRSFAVEANFLCNAHFDGIRMFFQLMREFGMAHLSGIRCFSVSHRIASPTCAHQGKLNSTACHCCYGTHYLCCYFRSLTTSTRRTWRYFVYFGRKSAIASKWFSCDADAERNSRKQSIARDFDRIKLFFFIISVLLSL